MKAGARIAVAAIVFSLFAAHLCAQGAGKSRKNAEKPYKKDVELVVIPVSVTDLYNRPVTVLREENFKIYDNGKEQKIEHFSKEDEPISIGLVADISGSMEDKIDHVKEAVDEICDSFYLPKDEFMLVTVNDFPEIASPFTHDCRQAKEQLMFKQGKGQTSLLDGIYLALSYLKENKVANDRRVLIVISDGGDNRSRYTEGEIKDIVKEADVPVYVIGVFEPAIFYHVAEPGQYPTEEIEGPALLGEISDASGGIMFADPDPRKLKDIARKIAFILHNQYVLMYKPKNLKHESRGRAVWRKIKVELKNAPRGLQTPLQVHARDGYYYVPEN